MDTKEKRLQWLVDNVLMGTKNLADILGMKQSGVYKYLNGKQKIADKLGQKLTESGISYDWYLTGLGNIYADNKAGQIINQQFGDVMATMQKAGVRFVPTTNPQPTKIPVMLSPVSAGFPGWTFGSVGAEVDISKIFHEGSYFVIARGDSMTGARIEEGDWLLLDEYQKPKNGDIVVAEVEGALTVKRLKKNGVTWLLHPDSKNPKYEPLEFREGIRIVGVVTQIIVQP